MTYREDSCATTGPARYFCVRFDCGKVNLQGALFCALLDLPYVQASLHLASPASTMNTLSGNVIQPAKELPILSLSILVGLVGLLGYSFYNSLSRLWLYFWNTNQYSHGYIVPLIAVVLLYMRWDPSYLESIRRIAPSARLSGAVLLILGLGFRLFATRLGMETPDMLAFLPCLAGVVLMAGGWTIFRWAGPVIIFLVFMFPLPHRIQQAVLIPMKNVATTCSFYLLQLMNFETSREGNILYISGIPMGVVDACSGLRMLTVFLALCGAVAMLISKPLWERIVIFLSAIPIAIAVNALRITSTGMAYAWVGEDSDWVHYVFHDNAGLMMMPLAMLFLYLEIALLGMLFIEEKPSAVRQLQGQSSNKRKPDGSPERE